MRWGHAGHCHSQGSEADRQHTLNINSHDQLKSQGLLNHQFGETFLAAMDWPVTDGWELCLGRRRLVGLGEPTRGAYRPTIHQSRLAEDQRKRHDPRRQPSAGPEFNQSLAAKYRPATRGARCTSESMVNFTLESANKQLGCRRRISTHSRAKS